MNETGFAWYVLMNLSGFGPKRLLVLSEALRERKRSVIDLISAPLPDLISGLNGKIGTLFSESDLNRIQQLKQDEKLIREFENLCLNGIQVVGPDEPGYPCSFSSEAGAPVLFCKGPLSVLGLKGVAIVGARNAGVKELDYTHGLAGILASNGYHVVSGYARGVDTAAHVGALEANGTTTMVLSYGMDHLFYRPEVSGQISDHNACFVSQFLPGEPFSGYRAMARNRLVCAFSEAMVVIRSGPERDATGKMSGTFHAAKSALSMGIPVFILHQESSCDFESGNQALIRLGAIEFLDPSSLLRLLAEKVTVSQLKETVHSTSTQTELFGKA